MAGLVCTIPTRGFTSITPATQRCTRASATAITRSVASVLGPSTPRAWARNAATCRRPEGACAEKGQHLIRLVYRVHRVKHAHAGVIDSFLVGSENLDPEKFEVARRRPQPLRPLAACREHRHRLIVQTRRGEESQLERKPLVAPDRRSIRDLILRNELSSASRNAAEATPSFRSYGWMASRRACAITPSDASGADPVRPMTNANSATVIAANMEVRRHPIARPIAATARSLRLETRDRPEWESQTARKGYTCTSTPALTSA